MDAKFFKDDNSLGCFLLQKVTDDRTSRSFSKVTPASFNALKWNHWETWQSLHELSKVSFEFEKHRMGYWAKNANIRGAGALCMLLNGESEEAESLHLGV